MTINRTTLLGQLGSPLGPYGNPNKIINGNALIDQRRSGSSVTSTAALLYTLDRFVAYDNIGGKFSVQQNAGAVVPPVGFTTYLGVTSLTSFSVAAGDSNFIRQNIEGYNCADLSWGTVNAKAITLSFWVYTTTAGTYGGAVSNSALNRSYPFTYSVAGGGAWEYKTVTIPGDTSGTWLTTNGIGLMVTFGLGVGTTNSGTAGAWAAAQYFSATGVTSVVASNTRVWYLTGVKVEIGSIATPFIQDDYALTLEQCLRYYEIITVPSGSNFVILAGGTNRMEGGFGYRLKRTTPTFTFPATGGGGGQLGAFNADGGSYAVSAWAVLNSGVGWTRLVGTVSGNYLNLAAICGQGGGGDALIRIDAEL